MPILSLVIPTRNRQKCAESAVRIALEECSDVEIIVSDNSDSNELEGRLEDLAGDSRVKYRYFSETLSVVENFERALNIVTGEYVMFLGDDDTVGPNLMEIVKWAKQNGIETINYDHNRTVLHYFWPGVASKRWGAALGGSLVLSSFSGQKRITDHRLDMVDALKNLGAGPRLLPRIYLGVVSKSLLDRVRSRYGRVFGGASPDVFSSHLIAQEAKASAVVDFPFVVPGAFSSSTSAMRSARSDVGSLNSTEHIQRFKTLKWNPKVPYFYSPHTVWAYSHLEAVRLAPEQQKFVSFGSLYAKCVLQSPGHMKETFAAWKRWAKEVGFIEAIGKVVFETTWESLRTVGRLVHTFIKGKPGGAAFQYCGISDTRDALVVLRRHLLTQGIKLHV